MVPRSRSFEYKFISPLQESLLPSELQRLGKTYEQQRQLQQQADLSYQQAQLQREQKLSELDKGCSVYRSMLGLEFERVGDERLRLVFTNIDPHAPSRAFAFQVFVDSSDHYHIEHCEPHLSGLPALADQLNKTNDFSVFVRSARREFKALCV